MYKEVFVVEWPNDCTPPFHFHPPPPISHLIHQPSSGMLEFVGGCETLREIQTTQGVTGSFKDHVLADWLMRHNPTKKAYEQVHTQQSL